MKPTLRLAACLALATTALPAAAAPEGNIEEGRRMTYTCTGCHGIAGYKNVYPTYHVPKIAGQNFDYLVASLNAYRTGERTHPTMRAQAQGYSPDELRDIALYLSTLTDQPRAR
jgi:cytochrome c553